MKKTEAEELLSQLSARQAKSKPAETKHKRLPRKTKLPSQAALTPEEQRHRTRTRKQQQQLARPKVTPELEKQHTVRGRKLPPAKPQRPRKQKRVLTPEELHEIRSAAAKKAASTRKAKEAAMPEEQRKLLHDIRAHRMAVNFAQSQGRTVTGTGAVIDVETGELFSYPPVGGGLRDIVSEDYEAPDESELDISYEDYTPASRIIVNQVRTVIEKGKSFIGGVKGYYQGAVRRNSANLEYMLDTAIAEIGEEAVASRLENAGQSAIEAANGACFDSNDEQVQYYSQRIAEILFGRALNAEESAALTEPYESFEVPF